MPSDLRFAVRALRRAPGFALAAILTLAIGIGANTAIFSLISAALLQPLPYPDAARLVQMWMTTPGGGGITHSPVVWSVFRKQTDAFAEVAAYDFGGPGVSLTGGGEPELVKAIHVSEPYFRVFGARLRLGRFFTRQEDLPNGAKVAVLSHALWRTRFASDPEIAGKAIALGHESYTVAGVLAADFQPDPPAQVFLPLQADPDSTSHASYLRVAALLQPGVTLEQANSRLRAATTQFQQTYPLFNREALFTAKPFRETAAGDVRAPLWILSAAVGLVLLIACSNVANLLLARGVARQREMAIRSALGAGRGRLILQMLSEALLLSFTGAALGLGLGWAAIAAVRHWNPEVILPGAGLDPRVLTFTLGIAVVTAGVFGLLPAMQAARAGMGVLRGPLRIKSLLVCVQMALSVVLLIGAGLMIRTFAALRQTNPGLEVSNVLTMDMSLRGTRFRDTADVARLVEKGSARLLAIPGVEAVATTWTLPVELAFGSSFVDEGRPLAADPVHGGTMMRPVSTGFFGVFRIPILRGRGFTGADVAAANSVAIVSESFARKYWPDGNAIGERITLDKHLGPDFAAPPREIVGIAADVHDAGIAKEVAPLVYIPQGQVPDGMTRIDARVLPLTWVVRTTVPPYGLAAAMQRELRLASEGLPVAHLRTMEEIVRQSTLRNDFYGALLVTFASLSLILAAVGLYGLMAYSMQQRRRELGIRMALGATAGRIARTVVLRSLLLAGIGITAGGLMSLVLVRFLATLLYGVKPVDPTVIAGASLTLAAVTVLASYLPARAAARVDAAEVLRCE